MKMEKINHTKEYCYRITHVDNLELILKNGIVAKKHLNASAQFIEIGNPEIIDYRSMTDVKIPGYGKIGDYVPFYFTPKSVMLYNILTGYSHPVVQKRSRDEILIIVCEIETLVQHERWFFTDGQGNANLSRHFNNLDDLIAIDWESIHQCNFRNDSVDFDRLRRYQAEFLVYNHIPYTAIHELIVYNESAQQKVLECIMENNCKLNVHIKPNYYF